MKNKIKAHIILFSFLSIVFYIIINYLLGDISQSSLSIIERGRILLGYICIQTYAHYYLYLNFKNFFL
jgi:hypothetical protein